jgi:hypothetical protein
MTKERVKKLKEAVNRAKASVKKNRRALKNAEANKVKSRERYLNDALARLDNAKKAYAEAKAELPKKSIKERYTGFKDTVRGFNFKKIAGYTLISVIGTASAITAFVVIDNYKSEEEAVPADRV